MCISGIPSKLRLDMDSMRPDGVLLTFIFAKRRLLSIFRPAVLWFDPSEGWDASTREQLDSESEDRVGVGGRKEGDDVYRLRSPSRCCICC
mmetsp:Transcript_7232/g.11436  ORF Transcript_7232/g.11436 Transcript_7232/m.11436 type:complete len:91 (-) Transcript_7232:717-989(-)